MKSKWLDFVLILLTIVTKPGYAGLIVIGSISGLQFNWAGKGISIYWDNRWVLISGLFDPEVPIITMDDGRWIWGRGCLCLLDSLSLPVQRLGHLFQLVSFRRLGPLCSTYLLPNGIQAVGGYPLLGEFGK
ncbi:hypothetical protein ACJJIQ_09620 [Microbulbifer sp. ANSA003]|uniref:hypothetical protein n=1 Tax=unclassified Microbulbifer TaxID=2619833 RepID=UPI004039F547